MPDALVVSTSLLCSCNFWYAVPLQLSTILVASSSILSWGQADWRSSILLAQISTLSVAGSKLGTKDANWLVICPPSWEDTGVDDVPVCIVPAMSPGSLSLIDRHQIAVNSLPGPNTEHRLRYQLQIVKGQLNEHLTVMYHATPCAALFHQ